MTSMRCVRPVDLTVAALVLAVAAALSLAGLDEWVPASAGAAIAVAYAVRPW